MARGFCASAARAFDIYCPATAGARAIGMSRWHGTSMSSDWCRKSVVWVKNGGICVSFTYCGEIGKRHMEGLQIYVTSCVGGPTAAFLALGHVVVWKGLGRIPRTRPYSRKVTKPCLWWRKEWAGYVDFEPCPWREAQHKLSCAQTIRALAVMHWWNRRQGKTILHPLDVYLSIHSNKIGVEWV